MAFKKDRNSMSEAKKSKQDYVEGQRRKKLNPFERFTREGKPGQEIVVSSPGSISNNRKGRLKEK